MSLPNLNDGIVIFSDTGNVMFTSTGEIVDNKKTIRKHKINKNIVHEKFNDMRQYTTSDFWDRFLYKCARNIFPSKNFKFTNDILYYKIKTKKHRDELFIDEEDLEKSFVELKKFLRDKGIKPNSEVKENGNFFEKDSVEITQWKSIQKELKNEKIIDFVERKKIEYDLDFSHTRQLESVIKVGIAGDILNNDNIIIRDGNIEDIKYLSWNKEKDKFMIDIINVPIKFAKNNKVKDENNYYTYNSHSNDNFSFSREMERLDIGKKWELFLENFYNKNGIYDAS